MLYTSYELKNIWRNNMKVIVTGGAGFIGHLPESVMMKRSRV